MPKAMFILSSENKAVAESEFFSLADDLLKDERQVTETLKRLSNKLVHPVFRLPFLFPGNSPTVCFAVRHVVADHAPLTRKRHRPCRLCMSHVRALEVAHFHCAYYLLQLLGRDLEGSLD